CVPTTNTLRQVVTSVEHMGDVLHGHAHTIDDQVTSLEVTKQQDRIIRIVSVVDQAGISHVLVLSQGIANQTSGSSTTKVNQEGVAFITILADYVDGARGSHEDAVATPAHSQSILDVVNINLRGECLSGVRVNDVGSTILSQQA